MGSTVSGLADAVLGVVIADLLLYAFPDLDEGELSLDIKRLPSISISEAATLFIGIAAAKAGNFCGYLAHIAAMLSLAMRASSGDSSGPASTSGGGLARVSTCCTSGHWPSISTRASISHRIRALDMRLTMPGSL